MANHATITLEISLIRIDGGTQSRVALNEDAVADYAAAIREGAEFPPVTVFHDGAAHWLADGFHRFFAYRAADMAAIPATIIPGTQRDAVLYSVGANAAHGLRRSNADKRRCVETLLKDAEWAGWSDGEIAKRCAVSQPFVSGIRRELTQNGFESPTERKGADGRIRNTTNIGAKPKADPAPRPEPEADSTPPSNPSAARPVADSEADSAPLPTPEESPPRRAPKPAKSSELEAENERLKKQVAALEAQNKEAFRLVDELRAEIESISKILDASDKEAAWHAEIKRLNSALNTMTWNRDEHLNGKNEYIRQVKSKNRQIERLEKQNKELQAQLDGMKEGY